MDKFWNLIPQITTPLAALCFLAGVAYWIIRIITVSNNRRKEATLKVDDPIAQQAAVSIISKEIPDITAAPIERPDDVREFAQALLNAKSSKFNRAINAFVIVVMIFAVIYLIPILFQNNSKDKVAEEERTFLQYKSWAQLKAIKERYPYATLAVIQHIKLRDVIVNGEKKRLAEFRNNYTISAVRDINASESVFQEEFTSSSGMIVPWAGSDEQTVTSNLPSKFWVKFALPKYQSKTIVTGANYYYDFPLKGCSKTSCFGSMDYGVGNWMTCYPNESDFIDKLTIIVESENFAIELPPNAMFRKEVNGNIKNDDGHCRVYSNNEKCTLVAQWDTLTKGECVALRVRWPKDPI